LAPVLWYSFGTITALLQEIVSLYPMLSPPTLTPQASNRVCNALALLQCVASHNDTKNKLVKSKLKYYQFFVNF
jgi:CCR4-NOT transcription complex subunit 9